MHELSIARCVVETASEALRTSDLPDAASAKVMAVHLRVGRLAGVMRESLEYCYDLAAQGTPLEGSQLVVHELPVVVFCGPCQQAVELPSIQRLRCPRCGTPSGDIRQGKELDLESIELA